jgi:hypothetical protein
MRAPYAKRSVSIGIITPGHCESSSLSLAQTGSAPIRAHALAVALAAGGGAAAAPPNIVHAVG